MRSPVRQLTFTRNHQHTVHEALVTEYERRKAEAELDGFDMPRLRVQQCLQLVVDILGQDPAVLIIDAIDEVEETRRHELLNALKQIVAQNASVVKVFITSRNDSTVFTLAPDTQKICVNSSDSRSDMEIFVHNRLECRPEQKAAQR